jgi:RNA polymerase sigma-70 factor (ECF subfamily)
MDKCICNLHSYFLPIQTDTGGSKLPVLDAAITAKAASWRTTADEPPDLEQVFAKYVDPIHRFIYSRVGNREDAEDLTSEVFLKATRLLDRERPEASVATWLFTVARTVLADHWRRYYRGGASVELDETRLGDIPDSPRGSEPSEASARRVSQVLGGLSDRYRRVLELRFLRGYSIQETAHEMGITPENVKVIQHRALAKAAQVAEGAR